MGLVMNYRNGKFLMGLYIMYKDLLIRMCYHLIVPLGFFLVKKYVCI
jgi:hypothetical protein